MYIRLQRSGSKKSKTKVRNNVHYGSHQHSLCLIVDHQHPSWQANLISEAVKEKGEISLD